MSKFQKIENDGRVKVKDGDLNWKDDCVNSQNSQELLQADETSLSEFAISNSSQLPFSQYESQFSQLNENGPESAALNNYLILNCVLDHLPHNDLVNCSGVNSNWRFMVKKKIQKYKVYLYDFCQLRQPNGNYAPWHQKLLKFEEQIEANGEKVVMNLTLQEIIRKLDNGVKGKSIWLKLSNSDLSHAHVQEFLRKFGTFITRFTFGRSGILEISDPIYSLGVWNLITTHLPHLDYLNFEKAPAPGRINGRSAPIPNVGKNFENVKILQFNQKYQFPYVTILQLLKSASNVERIHNFPLSAIHAVKLRKKVDAVKSIVYGEVPLIVNPVNFLRLKKFSEFQPRLEDLSICSSLSSRQVLKDATLPATVLNIFNQLLHSSKDTLEKLNIQTSVYFSRLDFPTLHNLKFLQLNDNPNEFFSDSYFDEVVPFKDGFNVNEIFPNLTHVDILIYINEMDLYHYPRILDQFLPLQTFHSTHRFLNVQHLKISKIMASQAIERIAMIFPNIKTLDITTDGSFLHKVLPVIWKHWPSLEFLTLKVLFCSRTMNRARNLDQVITGMTTSDILSARFRPSEVLLPRTHSILNMTDLKMLNIIFLHCTCAPYVPIVSLFSDISGTHGFSRLPQLSVFMAMHERSGRKEEFILTLAPIFPFVEFVDNYREVPRFY